MMTNAEAPTASPLSFTERFVSRLGELSRADLAVLKRNAGRTIAESHGAASVFFRLYPPRDRDRDEEIFFLVATLYGLNPRRLTGNFGKTMRALKKSGMAEDAADRRMSILLDSDFDLVDGFRPGGGELAYRLRQYVKLAASKEVGVDWQQLLDDLRWWGHPQKRAQKRWARSYFGTTASAETEE